MSEISTFRWFFAYLTSFCASIFVRIEFSEFQHGHSLGMTKSSIACRSPSAPGEVLGYHFVFRREGAVP